MRILEFIILRFEVWRGDISFWMGWGKDFGSFSRAYFDSKLGV